MNKKKESGNKRLFILGVIAIFVGCIALGFVVMSLFAGGDNGGGALEPVKGQEEVKNPGDNNNDPDTKISDDDKNKKDEVVITDEMQKVLQEVQKSETFCSGITIEGIDVAGKTKEEVKSLLAPSGDNADSNKEISINFQLGEELVPLKTKGVVLSSNIDDILEQAYNIGRVSDKEGNAGLADCYNQIQDLKSNPVSFTIFSELPEDKIRTLVHKALDSYNREPVEPVITGFDTEKLEFIIEDSQTGYVIDVDKTADDVIKALKNNENKRIIQVEAEIKEPTQTSEFLRSYLCKVSSTTSTTTDSYNRNTNIDIVCKKLDGLVLQPGEKWSFNDYIGERTKEAGFLQAPGIYDGALRMEYGGGICQANAMIFHSVVKADLQVDVRCEHSWPSDYVPIGTDATVSWGTKDFKFTNNTDYPIAFHAYYGSQKVTVEIYGRPLPDEQTIKFVGETNSRTAYTTEYIADPTLPIGKKETDRNGHDRITASAYKVYYDKDGKEVKREHAYSSDYYMITKKVRVGCLAEDGVTVFKVDKKTGELTPPEGYVSPEPTPDPNAPTDTPTDTPDNPTPEPTAEPTPTEEPDNPTPEPTEEPTPTPFVPLG